MLFEIWPFLGKDDGESELEVILRGTWAGDVLAKMKAHAAARRAAQGAQAEFEAAARMRHEKKKRFKQERHAARLAAKQERDKAWRERQKSG